MTSHRIDIRVYYEDTDFSGFVYHANYLRYMERGRTELLRALAMEQVNLQRDAGLIFVVRRMVLDFLKPARMDDMLAIMTTVVELRGASMPMIQEVRRGDEVLLKAEVTVAAVRDGRAVRLPDSLRRGHVPAFREPVALGSRGPAWAFRRLSDVPRTARRPARENPTLPHGSLTLTDEEGAACILRCTPYFRQIHQRSGEHTARVRVERGSRPPGRPGTRTNA